MEEEEDVAEGELVQLSGVVAQTQVAARGDLVGETSVVLLKALSGGVEQQVVADSQVGASLVGEVVLELQSSQVAEQLSLGGGGVVLKACLKHGGCVGWDSLSISVQDVLQALHSVLQEACLIELLILLGVGFPSSPRKHFHLAWQRFHERLP